MKITQARAHGEVSPASEEICAEGQIRGKRMGVTEHGAGVYTMRGLNPWYEVLAQSAVMEAMTSR
jgi:hypothetical protein